MFPDTAIGILQNNPLGWEVREGERVTGRKARGSLNRGNRLQVPDTFYLSLKQQEETNKC